MLSNRVAAKRAYHRRVEKMDSLQKENSFLLQVLGERKQRLQKLEALVRAHTSRTRHPACQAELVWPVRAVVDT